MKNISIDIRHALGRVTEADIKAMLPEADKCLDTVESGTGAGNDFLGWVKLPSETTDALVDDICATAQQLRSECEVVVEAHTSAPRL